METKLDDIFNTNLSKNSNIITEDLCSDLDISALLAKASVPFSHRRIADKYVIMKNICQFQIVQPRITNVEQSLLYKYGFNTLENSSISSINKEIALLKDWATSTDDNLRNDSIEMLKIRVKELKFILSYNYTINSNEMLKGYKAMETYLTSITKYYR